MTLWDEQFESHDALPALKQATEQLDLVESKLEDTEQREAHARLRQVIDYAREALGAVDPQLVVMTALDQIHDHAAQITTYLQQYAEAPQQVLLVIANSHADVILAQVQSLRPLTTTEDVKGVQATVSSFRRSIGQHARNIEAELATIEGRSEKLGEQLTVQEQTLEERLTTEAEVLDTRLAVQETKVAAQETQIDSVVTTFQTQFSEEQNQRTSQFSEVLEKARTDGAEAIVEAKDDIEKTVAEAQTLAKSLVDTTKATTDTELKALRDDVAKRVEELNELRAEAERAVGATGSAVLAGGYQETAKSEQRSANFWRVVSVLAFVVATLVAVYAVRYGVTDEFKPSRFFAKVTIGLPIIALAYYAARESGKHREQARLNKQIELQLASLDAYLRELPAKDRHRIKGDLAEGFFTTGFRAVEAAARKARRKPKRDKSGTNPDDEG